MSRLPDKVAVVTASSSGVGRAIALALASQGTKLIVCADLQPTALSEIPEETVKATHEIIQEQHGPDRAIFIKTNALVESEVQACVKEAISKGGRLDIVANVVGGAPPQVRVHETSSEDWEKGVAINLRPTFLFSKAALAHFITQSPDPVTGQRGCIINISSIYGLVAHTNGASYDAGKAAVINFTRSCALEYADDKIRCNSICPSFIRTALTKSYFDQPQYEKLMKDFVPLWRDSGAQDVAQAAVFLASGVEAGWVTGIAMPVDGGTIAR